MIITSSVPKELRMDLHLEFTDQELDEVVAQLAEIIHRECHNGECSTGTATSLMDHIRFELTKLQA